MDQSHRPKVHVELPTRKIAAPNPFLPKLNLYNYRPDPAAVAISLGSQELLANSIELPRRKSAP